MIVPDDLVYNFLVDLKKKDIDPIERARIIRTYCNNKQLSIRALAKELNISHSTLQDWVDYERLDRNDFIKLEKVGCNKKTIYKMLRETRGDKEELKSLINVELNTIIREAEIRLKSYINNPIFDDKTVDLIKDLKNVLNRLELHIERKSK